MGWWNEDSRWVSEDGVRYYFSEPYRGGSLSRLDCYRRMLAEPARTAGDGSTRLAQTTLAGRFFRRVELTLAKLA
jgi:hypothetical protein